MKAIKTYAAGLGTALALISASAAFNAQAGGDMRHYLDRHYGQRLEQTVRSFETLCAKDGQIHARFKPNIFDYYTKEHPNGPITKAEHVRDLLIMEQSAVEGFIAAAEGKGAPGSFLVLQLDEMKKAKMSFDDMPFIDTMYPSCDDPFPQP
ncbi:MAG: hypothetical protein H6867_01565 [Rhodospirillales bacterium]|nr:hypothetical protein [Rhodospirillales bacterium]MCB9997205.1 hypothetical protein [Rhodospirillales bacterium]